VEHGVVVALEEAGGGKQLVAYVVMREGKSEVRELRQKLQERLPEYMIPTVWMKLESLPMTPDGKIDRRALPQPDQEPMSSKAYAPPRTPIESILCGIWEEILGVAPVGINDNFFELGGHSIALTRMVSRVTEYFDVDLPLSELFDVPTIAMLAAFIQELTGDEEFPLHDTQRSANV